MPGVISSGLGDGGQAHRCPVCHHVSWVESSITAGDAPCPFCGHLLWPADRPSWSEPREPHDAVRARTFAAPRGRWRAAVRGAGRVRTALRRAAGLARAALRAAVPAGEAPASGGSGAGGGVWDRWLDG
jgi:hypothetical protein